MSAQAGQPPVQPPPGATAPAPGQPLNAAQAREAQKAQLVQMILSGEIPGVGYLDPDEAKKVANRRPAPTAQEVREEALRTMMRLAKISELPFGRITPADAAKAFLAYSQGYLLLDPAVDEEGVPIQAKADAEAKAAVQYPAPPRVKPNAAEQAIKEEHKPQEEALSHDRGQRPRPQPRVGA